LRLLLDEMWSHQIALQLRRRDHDVIAATEPEHEARYGGLGDDLVFEHAQEDGRAIVTENVGDFERARVGFEHTGQTHYGLIYALAPQFDRNLGARVIGPMVRALDGLLRDHPDHDPYNLVIYLRRDT
jgi:hypothetical protein